jgi:hypothetical protein
MEGAHRTHTRTTVSDSWRSRAEQLRCLLAALCREFSSRLRHTCSAVAPFQFVSCVSARHRLAGSKNVTTTPSHPPCRAHVLACCTVSNAARQQQQPFCDHTYTATRMTCQTSKLTYLPAAFWRPCSFPPAAALRRCPSLQHPAGFAFIRSLEHHHQASRAGPKK